MQGYVFQVLTVFNLVDYIRQFHGDTCAAEERIDSGDHRELRPHRQRHPQDLEELLAVEARLLHADQVGKPLDPRPRRSG